MLAEFNRRGSWVAVITLAVLFLAGCQPAAPTPAAQAVQAVPAGWHVLKGYSLAYPPEWEVTEQLRYSRMFTEIQKEPAGMGPPLRLYVSAFPNDYTDQDGQVYNFIPSESIREFMALPVGKSKLKVADANPPDAWTYTRLPDQTVAGKTALVIENSTVWEAPTGTKDRVLVIV